MKNWIDLINNVQNDTYRYAKQAFIALLCAMVGFLSYPFFYGQHKAVQITHTGNIRCNVTTPVKVFLLKDLPSQLPRSGR